jgi:sugar O-acyltransferase (sialic acid O-acetyltransferase NeuD family)
MCAQTVAALRGAEEAEGIVVFGLEGLSRLAALVLTHEGGAQVAAFTVHRRYCSQDTLDSRPVVPFEDLERTHPPERFALFAPLGWRRMGGLRADVFAEGRARGYRFASYLSPRAVTWPDLQVSNNVMIYDSVVIQPFARVGHGCVLRSGAFLSHDVQVGDHSFIASRATVGGRAVIGERCVIGLNATICSGIRVAPRCFVTAGAVLTTDTEPGGIYRGNPARRARLPSDRIDRLRI